MMLPRFYPILDSGFLMRRGIDVIDAARAILDAGARILQFRHKGHVARETFNTLESLARLCEAAGAQFVVNDRADLAWLVHAALHLGQDDLPPASARLIVGSQTPIGFSTHNEAQFQAAAKEPVDYLALGPIFGTSSKENPDPVVGLEELRRLRPLSARQIVAIGGITRETAHAVLKAGADSVAVIGDLVPEDGTIGGRAKEWISVLS
jgi:thiamine-phosphate pyrophosphorylase